MSTLPPAGWHADPFRRHEHRYWDGAKWTDHVASQGQQRVDPAVYSPPPAPRQTVQVQAAPVQSELVQPVVPQPAVAKKVQKQVAQSFGVSRNVEAALLRESVLVVNQKPKLGAKTEYAVFDQEGHRIGTVQEIGSTLLRMAAGASGASGTRKFQILDPQGAVIIALHRPAKLFRSKVIVVGADGVRSEIAQKNLGAFKKVWFALESGGRVLGSLRADDSAAWNFTIQDESGKEVARITKTWAGWAKERFTTADNYVVQIHEQLTEPMRSLVVASALAVDTALKEDDNWHRRRAR